MFFHDPAPGPDDLFGFIQFIKVNYRRPGINNQVGKNILGCVRSLKGHYFDGIQGLQFPECKCRFDAPIPGIVAESAPDASALLFFDWAYLYPLFHHPLEAPG